MKMIAKYTVITIVIVIAMAMSACSTTTPHEKLLGHLETIVNTLYDNKEDIPKAAAAVKTYVDSNVDEIKTLMNESLADGTNPVLTDTIYEERLISMIKKHSELETKYALLIRDPAVTNALAPVSEAFETSKAAQPKAEN